MDGNLDTNAENVNLPEEAANKPAITMAGTEQMLDVTTEGGLHTGAVLPRITTMLFGRVLLNAWEIVDVMSFEKGKDVPAVRTTTVAA